MLQSQKNQMHKKTGRGTKQCHCTKKCQLVSCGCHKLGKKCNAVCGCANSGCNNPFSKIADDLRNFFGTDNCAPNPCFTNYLIVQNGSINRAGLLKKIMNNGGYDNKRQSHFRCNFSQKIFIQISAIRKYLPTKSSLNGRNRHLTL